MCLTAYFIDDDWNINKRILNFCPIIEHKIEEVGKGVEKCLLDWGIDRVSLSRLIMHLLMMGLSFT